MHAGSCIEYLHKIVEESHVERSRFDILTESEDADGDWPRRGCEELPAGTRTTLVLPKLSLRINLCSSSTYFFCKLRTFASPLTISPIRCTTRLLRASLCCVTRSRCSLLHGPSVIREAPLHLAKMVCTSLAGVASVNADVRRAPPLFRRQRQLGIPLRVE